MQYSTWKLHAQSILHSSAYSLCVPQALLHITGRTCWVAAAGIQYITLHFKLKHVICVCCAGISAHQKLDLLGELVRLLGYESVTVFGDCFDEVTLLDPVRFPGK